MKKTKIICAFCNKETEVWDYRKKTAKYCSAFCRYRGISKIKKSKRELLLASGRKKCSRCKEIKTFSNFYTSKQKWDGYDCWCKKCKLIANQKYTKNPEVAARKREFRKVYNLNTKESRKYNRMKHLYGITFNQYNALLKQQEGKCKICREPLNFNRLAHIDHCHETKIIRGILCNNCNQGLGLFKDNINILKKAVEYLCPDCHDKQNGGR